MTARDGSGGYPPLELPAPVQQELERLAPTLRTNPVIARLALARQLVLSLRFLDERARAEHWQAGRILAGIRGILLLSGLAAEE